MKVILKEDVENLGARGVVVNVKDGFARNYLLPKGMAMRFTAGAQKVLGQERRMYELRQLKAKEEAMAVADKLSAVELTVSKRAGDQDVLYGSVTPTDIADLLKGAGFVVAAEVTVAQPAQTAREHVAVHFVVFDKEDSGHRMLYVFGELGGGTQDLVDLIQKLPG